MVKKITKENFDEEVKTRILVDFNAEWCGPCKMLAPIIEDLSQRINVGAVNVDEEEELAKRFGVMSIPCLIIFENGEEVKRSVGFMSKTDLEEFVK